MKYAIVRDDGVTELREDSYELLPDAILLSDEEFEKLTSGKFVLIDKQIVENPNPPKSI